MSNNLPNQYSLGNLPGIEPQTRRVFQDFVDQLNYLTGEVTRLRGRDLVVMPAGAARRESPVEGLITIPYRDAGGQDGSIRVSPDGVIVSYVNPAESIFPYVDLRSVGNVGAGLDPLHSFTIPAGTLARDGDTLYARYKGDFGATANTKQVQITADGQNVANTGLFSINSCEWVYDVYLYRLNPTQLRTSVLAVNGFINRDSAGTVGGNANIFATGPTITVSNLNTTNIVLLVSGQSGTSVTDDVIQRSSWIEFYRPRTVKLV